MIARVRDFPKMPHRTFREDSCIQSPPHAADPQKPGRFFDFHAGFDKKSGRVDKC